MKKNKLPAVDFAKIFDDFGEQAAIDTMNDVADGKISVETVQKYLYDESESREEYAARLKREGAELEASLKND